MVTSRIFLSDGRAGAPPLQVLTLVSLALAALAARCIRRERAASASADRGAMGDPVPAAEVPAAELPAYNPRPTSRGRYIVISCLRNPPLAFIAKCCTRCTGMQGRALQ